MRFAILIAAAALSAHGGSPRDAHRLKAGRFVYHDLDHGREVGRSRLTIRQLDPERYEFAADISGDAVQRWTSIATRAFAPISATITFGPDTVGNEPRFSLSYHNGHVTGFVVRGARRTVDTIVPAGVVDQRIDWAAVMASDLTVGRELHFAVYDPSIGVSSVRVTVGPVEPIEVPAGTFATYPITYRVAKATGTEEYRVFATRSLPRVMVREVFPGGVVTDLVAVEQ